MRPIPGGATNQRRRAPTPRVRPGRQRRAARRPHCGLAADPDDVRGDRPRGQLIAERSDDAVVRSGDERRGWDAVRAALRNLLERDLPFGAERDGLRDAHGSAASAVLGPGLGQVQAIGDRHARVGVSQRKRRRHLAVLLFAEDAAVLAGHAHRVAALLREARVVDDPRLHAPGRRQGREHGVASDAQHGGIVPRGIRDKAVHRLMARRDMARIDACGHRLDALPLARQAQAHDVGPQRLMPVPVAEGGGETLNIRVKPLGARGREVEHTLMLTAYPMNSLTFVTQ